jgi:excisionase family DNA binding protein
VSDRVGRSLPGTILEPLLTSDDLAQLLSVSQRTLEAWAYKGTGPRVTKVGRHRRYRPADVRSYLDAQAAS